MNTIIINCIMFQAELKKIGKKQRKSVKCSQNLNLYKSIEKDSIQNIFSDLFYAGRAF